MKVLFRENLKQICLQKNGLFERAITSLLGILLFAFVSMPVSAQSNIHVNGRITNESGQPVPKTSITVKGSKTGTTADDNGNYEITVPSNGTLVVTAINYTIQEVGINNRQTVDVTLVTLEKTE